MKRIRIYAGLLILSIASITSCSKDNSGNNPSIPMNQVTMNSDRFHPQTLTVTVGTTVTWTNKEDDIHTVTSDNGLFNSGDLSLNQTYSYKFSTAGTYNYHCIHHVHQGMVGSVIVR